MLKFIRKILIYFLILSVGSTIVLRFVPVYFTPLMVIRLIQNSHSGMWKHDWIPIEEMPINIQKAVIASEDGHFTTHNGFDFKSIQKAWSKNKNSDRIRGGSTISQQTAKNVFLWNGRNYFRKGLEAYFTILIEFIWGKERIMEVYLNSIEMGNGVYGIEAAAQHWYHKPAKKLTNHEAASIAAMLPNPRKYNPVKKGAYMSRRSQYILRQMKLYNNPQY